MPLLPPELGLNPVLAGLLHCMAFLELSGDDTVDPDWAVEAMEHVAAYLHRLPGTDREAIASQLERTSKHLQAQRAPDKLIDFVANFLAYCGVDEQAGAV
jgi:hypothetical protein